MVSAAAATRMQAAPMRRFLTLADMSKSQLQNLLRSAREFKRSTPLQVDKRVPNNATDDWLNKKAIGLLFTKRSTRTRIAAEVAVRRLGGYPIFLGQDDIQLGVNESLRDTASVLQALVQGIFARVGPHSEIETLATHTNIPVINALSDRWHPTQVLADLLTIAELSPRFGTAPEMVLLGGYKIRPLTVAYIGDSTNVLHDMLVSYPRLGLKLRVATPADARYRTPSSVLARVRELKCDSGIVFTHDPKEAVRGADVVVTDTWISMGQEAEKADRLKAFKGFQVTEQLCKDGGANPDWVFMHCLPRKPDEVSDEVFYGPRSVVFHEAHNRLPTIQAVFAAVFQPHGVAKPKPTPNSAKAKSQ